MNLEEKNTNETFENEIEKSGDESTSNNTKNEGEKVKDKTLSIKKQQNKTLKKVSNNLTKRNPKKLMSDALSVPVIQVAEKLGLPITSKKSTKCINPAHFDNYSTMIFDEKENIYKCEVCGTSGTTIDMVRLILHITKLKAAEWILDKVENSEEYKKFIPEDRKKVILTGGENLKIHIEKTDDNEKSKKISLNENDQATQDYKKREKLIKNGDLLKMYYLVKNNLIPISQIRIGIGFIKEKQINPETMDKLGIGVIANSSHLETELVKRFNVDDLVTAGLFIQDAEKNDPNYFKFAFKEHNVIFPYFSGKSIVFLQGRRLDNKEPIYTTSFPHQPFIYNYNILRELKEKDTLIICIDIVETVSLIDKGLNAVNIVNPIKFRKLWIESIQCKNIILISEDKEIQNKLGSIFIRNKVNIRLANYDKVFNTSKKRLNEVGELFKKDSSKDDDVPFWKKKD